MLKPILVILDVNVTTAVTEVLVALITDFPAAYSRSEGFVSD